MVGTKTVSIFKMGYEIFSNCAKLSSALVPKVQSDRSLRGGSRLEVWGGPLRKEIENFSRPRPSDSWKTWETPLLLHFRSLSLSLNFIPPNIQTGNFVQNLTGHQLGKEETIKRMFIISTSSGMCIAEISYTTT